jgi:hypothetical protein
MLAFFNARTYCKADERTPFVVRCATSHARTNGKLTRLSEIGKPWLPRYIDIVINNLIAELEISLPT